jgi:hypothetical protein
MINILNIWEAVAGTSLDYLSVKAANCRYIDVCDPLPISLRKMQDQKSLSLG